MSSKKMFIIYFYIYKKCLKIHQLNIIEIIKKNYKIKKLVKDIKAFLKNKKKKSNKMVVNDTKIFQKIKSKSLFSIEKNIIK